MRQVKFGHIIPLWMKFPIYRRTIDLKIQGVDISPFLLTGVVEAGGALFVLLLCKSRFIIPVRIWP